MKGINADYIGHCQWNIDNLEGRDADALAGLKEPSTTKSTTDKEEIIKKMLAEKDK